MQDASAQDDFRLKRASLPVDQVVYDINTLAEGDTTASSRFAFYLCAIGLSVNK
jgi:hypothetical protein